MNRLIKMNTSMEYFDPDILEQLWEHTNKNPRGKIFIKDYIQTLIDAKNMLNENIKRCQSTELNI